MKWLSLCLLISFISDKIWAQGVVVKLGTRGVRGVTRTAVDGIIFNAFYGIPYAIPPVGRLRFKAPIEAPPWFGTLDATKIPNVCVQLPEARGSIIGDEDCLTLNIYTPKNAQEGDNIPVMFYIYGGIFTFGSSTLNGPQHFMKRDIIIVMPNYRLGALGFLSTGDDVISGNMGLKDQSMALKWVKHNIHFFGGDSNRITIHGHSSGAMSAHLHTLSPMSKGLYNRAIFQSGTGLCASSFFDKDVSGSIAKEVAQQMGCNSSTSQQILGCFLNLPPEIFATAHADRTWKFGSPALIRPTIEDINSEKPFLTTPPINIEYESTDQEWMIGMTSGEGTFKLAIDFVEENGGISNEMKDNYRKLLPITLEYFWHSKNKCLDHISDSFRTYYLSNQETGADTLEAVLRLYNQGTFGYCTNEALRRYSGKKYVYLFDYVSGYTVYRNQKFFGKFSGRLSNDGERAKELNDHYRIFTPTVMQYFWHLKNKYLDYISDLIKWYYFGNQEIGANTSEAITELFSQGTFGYYTNDALRRYSGKKYVYLFDYVSGFTASKNTDGSGIYGIGHADELPLLFYITEKSIYLNKFDRFFGDEMVKRWTNFAYSGNPNKPFTINSTIFGLWRPSLSPEVDFLRIKLNGSMETNFYNDEYRLWKRLPIFSKYDRLP